MASSTAENEIAHEFLPAFRKYKYGGVEKLMGNDVVPASVDPNTGVQSKDVIIATDIGVSARLYLPKNANLRHKLPLLVYFHGGAFVVESAFSPAYHNHLNLLVAEANVVVVSVDYRLAPNLLLPNTYEDVWVAVKWVASQLKGDGQEPWLKDYVDFESVFFGGDSSGGNIAHNMAMRVGSEKMGGIKLVGIVLNHPFFWGEEPVGNEAVDKSIRARVDKFWLFLNPTSTGSDDPVLNPGTDLKISSLGCNSVLVCVGEKDPLKDRSWYYHDVLSKSGWKGKVEVMECKGADHAFYLLNPASENAVAMLKRVASFLNIS